MKYGDPDRQEQSGGLNNTPMCERLNFCCKAFWDFPVFNHTAFGHQTTDGTQVLK